jgi:hypothetical protein
MTSMKTTIIQAAVKALAEIGRPATASEIYNYINANNLYDFKAKDPESVVKSALRRHSKEPAHAASKQSAKINKFEKDKYYFR